MEEGREESERRGFAVEEYPERIHVEHSSDIRQRLAALAAVADPSEEQLPVLERRHRAAIAAGDPEPNGDGRLSSGYSR